jgi:molecular chaperone GrpE
VNLPEGEADAQEPPARQESFQTSKEPPMNDDAYNPLGAPPEETPESFPCRDIPDEELAAACRERVCPSCQVAAEAGEVRLRALAEMENFKKRLQREKDEQARYATENVLAGLLPTLDNFDLALQYGGRAEACKDVILGVEMTRKLLLEAVRNHGLEPLGAEGEAFDPDRHEAIGQEEREGMEDGAVLKVMQKGYMLKDRLLRPAKVIVNGRAGSRLDRTV